MTIFATHAPLYWEAGLQAIPLWPNEKKPSIVQWQTFATDEISQTYKDVWLATKANGNLGLALGPKSNLCMIDVDTDDPRVISAIEAILPPSPWKRQGRKGYMRAYRYSGFKTFRIKAADGSMLVEGLSSGTQCVLPPSIHPDTQKPYTANCDLFDPEVLLQLHTLPQDLEETLRGSLERAGIDLSVTGRTRVTDYVAMGARDTTMTSMAGLFSYGVLRGELTFKEAIARLVAWNEGLVEKVAGDDLDITKGVTRLAEFLLRDVVHSDKKRSLPPGWDLGLTADERTAFGFDAFTDENIAWTCEDITKYLMREFGIHDPNSNGRRVAVEYALARMSNSNLSQLEEDELLGFILKTSLLGYTRSALKARLGELKQGGIIGQNQTEIAQEMIKELEVVGKLAHVGGFWQWAGSHFVQVSDSQILKSIALSFGHLLTAKKSGDHQGILAIMRNLVLRETLVEVNQPGVNFANGYLTPKLELLPHHPDYGCTYTLPFRYMPELATKAPRFQRFLTDCWGHDPDFEDKKRTFQEALAVTLFGLAHHYERAFCLTGIAGSGKSQLLKIIACLIPNDSTCAVNPQDWSDRFLPAQMAGKLLNLCGELHESKTIDGQIFKQVTSGEAMMVQHKNQQPFKLTPKCAHWFASNHLPRTNDTSGGFNRRWLMFTFNHKVSAREKVLDLGNQIVAEEREAITAWAAEAISGVLDRQDYSFPPSHLQKISEMGKMNNSLRQFLEDPSYVVLGVGGHPIQEFDLYNAYHRFAGSVGIIKPVGFESFRQKMHDLAYDLDFRVRVVTLANGAEDCVYENLSLAVGKTSIRRVK